MSDDEFPTGSSEPIELGLEPLESGAAAPPPIPVPTGACWRCGKEIHLTLPACPHCAAASRTASSVSPRSVAADRAAARPFLIVIGFFAALLLTSIIQSVAMRSDSIFVDPGAPPPSDEEVLGPVIAIEVVDTMLVLAALAVAGAPRYRAGLTPSRKAAAWLLFMPVLGGLLLVNFAYHWVLQQWLQLPLIEELFADKAEMWPLMVVIICVQPAVIEELFFRRLALDSLVPMAGVHAAVIISSLMFAMAHIGVPLSMPMLAVLGVGLGYARLASDGLLLPMTLHFIHNAIILGLSWLQVN
jgi:membrane protease YdiL (CAAX protease family)